MRDCFKWGSQIWHIIPFPNNSFQNPCCVPCSSLSNPIKIPDGAYIVKIWHAIPCFFNKCFHLPPAIPILVPIVFPKYSHITPGSFPDRSHIFPRSFPVLHPVPIQFSQHFPMLFPDHSQFCPLSPSFSQLFPLVFPGLSQHLPMVFPDHSQFCPHPPLFYPCFSKLLPMVSQIVFRFGYMSSLEPDSCGQKKQADSWLFPWKS